MDPADQEFAGDVDVGTMAQRARHDRLNHRKDVLNPVIELVDDRGEPAFEADPHLDFTAKPQIIVGDVSEKPTDDTGQRKSHRSHDDRRLLGACRGVGLGVIAERPVAVSERHGSHHRGCRPFR